VLSRPEDCLQLLPPAILSMVYDRLSLLDVMYARRVCSPWSKAKAAWTTYTYSLRDSKIKGLLRTCVPSKLKHLPQLYVTDHGFWRLATALSHLETVGLLSTDVTGAVLRHMPQTVKDLHVTVGNTFRDPDFASLATLSLASLKMVSCSTDLAFVRGLASSLTNLDLRNSNITDAGVANLATLHNLNELSLAACTKVTDDGLLPLAALKHLTHLNLSCLEVTGTSFPVLGKIALQHLNLSCCTKITTANLLPIFAQTNTLRYLNITCCKIKTLLTLPPNLEELDISACANLGDATLLVVAGLLDLRSLSIGSCEFTTAGYRNLIGSPVQTLCLRGTLSFGDAELDLVCNLLRLTSLDIYCCSNLTKRGLARLLDLPLLKKITMARNAKTRPIEHALAARGVKVCILK